MVTGMQPVNPTDPRPMYQKIANSIRADILAGNLVPGQRLPSIQGLGETFGVARMTISHAIDELKQEGFLRTVPGGGIYVARKVEAPEPSGEQDDLTGLSRYIYEMGVLKKAHRAGWLIPGIPIPETIAAHSFRTAIIGMVLASLEGGDVGRTVLLCLLHDTHESRVGDIASVARPYVRTVKPALVTQHQTEGMPALLRAMVRDAIQEFEARESREAVIARDADKVEAIVQGREYQREGGYNTTEWLASAAASLSTESAKRLAGSIFEMDPQEWWQYFVKSYNELTAIGRNDKDLAD